MTQVWLSVSDYATKYGMSPDTVKKLRDAGLLDSFRFGRKLVRIRDQPPSDGQVRAQAS